IVGMDYLKLGSPERAIPFLQHALKLDPSNRDARQALASSYLGQQDFRNAAEEFRQIATFDSDKAEAWFKLGHEYLDLSARLAFRGARLYRESAWGHRFLGDLLFQRDRWEDAVKEYQKALSADPRQSGPHTSLGQTYLHAGKLDEAEKEFHLELQLDSSNELAWIALANLQLTKGQATAVLESLSKAWEISPEFLNGQRSFPSTDLPPESAKASVSRLQNEPDGAPKHFLLAALYAAANENALSDSEWKSFEAGFSAWQQAQNAQPNSSNLFPTPGALTNFTRKASPFVRIPTVLSKSIRQRWSCVLARQNFTKRSGNFTSTITLTVMRRVSWSAPWHSILRARTRFIFWGAFTCRTAT